MDPARDPRAHARPPLSAPRPGTRGPGAAGARAARRGGAGPALGDRLARWLRPPRRLSPTRAGWIFFALTFGVGFAAVNTGNNLLYLVLSLMLSFLVLSGVFSESALRGVTVERRIPGELFAGAPASVALEIRNTKERIAAFALVVEDLRLPDPERRGAGPLPAGRVFVLRIPPAASETRLYRLYPERRGELDFAGFRLSTRFPFGLFSKALWIDAPQTALVYPGLEREAPPAAEMERMGSGRPAGTERSAGGEAAGLRDHRPGDAVRRLHWRASLRTGRLVTRELERERDAEAEVRLPTRGVAPGDRFERAVRRAAAQAVALLEAGTTVALRTDGVRLAAGSGPGQRRAILRFLARVEPEPAGAPAPRSVA